MSDTPGGPNPIAPSPADPTGGATPRPVIGSERQPPHLASPSVQDWPAQATDSIVRVVDSVRDKTAGPAISAATVLIYGLAILLLVIPLSIWLLIALMRITEGVLMWIGDLNESNWLGDFLAEPMWIVYLLYGTLFLLVGLWFWRKAKRAAPI